jgi:hypothetical protein
VCHCPKKCDKSAKKFVKKTAAPSPKVKITILIDIDAYAKNDTVLECRLANTFLEKMRTSKEYIQPYATLYTAHSGAQANVIGDKHLEGMGMDISSMHPTRVTMDFANNTMMKAFGVFYG